jgi:hypothetical protein
MFDDTSQADNTRAIAYSLLVHALHCAVRWIETSTVIDGVAGATLEAQATALARGWKPTRQWAWAVEAALYLADQVVLPLRPGESARMTLRERTHSADFTTVHVRLRRPKAGGLVQLLYHDGHPGVYPVALYRLHVMAGGARDLLLSSRGPGAPPCTTFYVPSGGSSRLDVRSFHQMLAWCLRLAEVDLGQAAGVLREAGLARPEIVRLVVASHLTAHRGLHEAARLLGLSPEVVTTSYRSWHFTTP